MGAVTYTGKVGNNHWIGFHILHSPFQITECTIGKLGCLTVAAAKQKTGPFSDSVCSVMAGHSQCIERTPLVISLTSSLTRYKCFSWYLKFRDGISYSSGYLDSRVMDNWFSPVSE